MAGDHSRFTFNPQKNYYSVLMQQGRVQLDSDWNEAQEVSDRRWRAETLDLMGQAAVPETTPDAFRIQSDGTGSFTIGIGRLYVDGLLAENHGLEPQYNSQLGEIYGTKPIPYNQQPYYPNPTSILSTPAGTTDLVYLDVWQREVTVLEDPAIQEIALGGPDTTTRLQTVWQVKTLTNVSTDAGGTVTCGATIPAWDALTKPSAGRLTTIANEPPKNTDPCIISPQAGYRGVENRLYRVEVHVGGPLGTAKFKWSRDNGSIVSAVEKIASGGDRLTVRRIGRDAVLRFKVGDWVEVLDDSLEFSDNPVGHLAKVTNIVETSRELVIDPPIPASFNFPTNATTNATNPTRHTRVRRWDQKHDTDGLLTVSASTIDIEDGIKVSFSVDGTIGADFKVGDTWVFAARAANAAVELLDKAPPRRILHHYARLALVTKTGEGTQPLITDCRPLFPAARCCIVVRPGEDIQAAINKLCKTGGCICLAPGIHQLNKPLLIYGCKNLTIQGVGNATRLIYSPTKSNANAAMVYVVGRSQNIRLEDFLAFASVMGSLVAVDEDSRLITLDHLTLINALATKSEKLLSTCILLGNCCHVSVTASTLLGNVGVLQADVNRLQRLRKQIALARSPQTPPNPTLMATASPPPTVGPLTELMCHSNTFYVLNVGVFLEDALDGSIIRNRFQGFPSDLQLGRTRNVQLVSDQSDIFIRIDKLLSLLACTSVDSLLNSVSSIGIVARLLSSFEITDNQINSPQGIFLGFARRVNIMNNRIEFGHSSKEEIDRSSNLAFLEVKPKPIAAIAIGFGFEIRIHGNYIHGTIKYEAMKPSENLAQDYLNSRTNTGYLGIALGTVRGITIDGNHIHATSGIGAVRWLREHKYVKGATMYPKSVLRVLGLGRAWRVFVELAWVLWQFIQIARQSPTGAAPANSLTRPEFAIQLVKGLVALLTTPDLIPNFIGKATISQNEMQVSRFGVCFSNIFTVGGLQILGNRISGFTETGILVHPWLSVSFPDLTAQLLYCGLEWILGVLSLLRDALDAMLNNKPPVATTGAGNWTATEIGIALVSWTVSFCAKYCRGEPTSGGTPNEETPQKSPSEDLKDAIDDLLNNLDLAWLDDLVNQSYVIDGNTMRGSGDGIWIGIDGSQISHNHVTIHPANTAPFETMVLGIVMRQLSQFINDLTLLPLFLIEMDRDLILFAALLLNQTLAENLTAPTIAELNSAINTFLSILPSTSPLHSPTVALNNALQTNQPDAKAIKAALVVLLTAISQNTKGYGIALMGADMTCIHNQVYGTTSCGVEALTRRASIGNFAVAGRPSPPVVRHPAIAGIWHFSNILNLSFEILAEPKPDSKATAVQPKGSIGRSLHLITLVIAHFLLLSRKDRGLHVQSNTVETALAYGIRTLDVTGLKEVSILDNTVKNAARYAIAHQSLINQDQKCYVKVHRNTITRTNEVFDFLAIINSQQ
jgi:hypothetical protein